MMINNLLTEIGYLSINHFGEELCGDHVEIVSPKPGTYVVVLADGLGSGVKANILSTLTSQMLAKMIANNISFKECVRTMAETLPVCHERHIAYSTFTVLKIENNRSVEIFNYDNPMPIFLRNGQNIDYSPSEQIIDGKKITHFKVQAELYDTFFLIGDGAIHAGIGQTLNFGWDRPEIIDYMSGLYHSSYSSKSLATQLIDRCNNLYNKKPGDDTTCVCVRVRKREVANLLIGPASNKDDDKEMLSLFFGKEGKHIVSGGTTSNMVAKYLGESLDSYLEYVEKDIPPISYINGVDLVTEGVITINRVLDYANNSLGDNSQYFDWCYKQDGASQIAKILIEEATDINFFVGCAVNPAHQKEGLPINFTIKMQLIEELSKCLKQMGKNIKVSYF